MNISGMQTNFANAISPFSPLGKQAVGQEETDSKESTLKPIEQPADIFRGEQQKEKKDLVEDVDGKNNFESQDEKEEEKLSSTNSDGVESEKKAQEQEIEKQQQEDDQKMIQELSARDREVRAHERAHAAVGGQHAGAPTYTYQRGPDGVSYAVGGEVSISTSKVAGNPQATIEKAQQVRRAALAPAEPSPQDRRVAASATQMESEARQELIVLQQKQAQEAKVADESSDKEAVSFDGVHRTSGSGPIHADRFAGSFININA
ncbi:MAG: putative metalloprotease CJM1_0395 family protein [Cellvibrionaceae bacterium]